MRACSRSSGATGVRTTSRRRPSPTCSTRPIRRPRLVVLNSCQSGAGGATDLFSGTAAALAHSGIRAVAAMQFSISDSAALAFARGFYAALAHGRGIDEAVRSGRIGILGLGRGTLEWVTPVLYLRGDARLFDLVPVEPPGTTRVG